MDPTMFYIIVICTVSGVICKLNNSLDIEPKELKISDKFKSFDKLQEKNVSAVQFWNNEDLDEVFKSFLKLFQDFPLNGSIVSTEKKNYRKIFKSLQLLLADENLQAFSDEYVSNNYNIIEPNILKLWKLKHQYLKIIKTQNLLQINKKRSRSEIKIHRRSNTKQRNRRESNDEAKETLSHLNITARVARHGFSARDYTVITEDGYVLGLQRIWAERVLRKDEGEKKRVPVLLMHGLLLSASFWIDAGPRTGLAYLLARAGHDVWLGNARGSYYSREHTTLDPKNSAYWQFSGDEMGKYDLRAFIDKVLNETGVDKLNYIGFSQGGGTFFYMCSELPEYCSKVRVMIAVAPSGRHLFTKSPVFRLLTEFYERHEQALLQGRIFEVLPKNGLAQKLFNSFCRKSSLALRICELSKDAFDGRHPGSFTRDSILNMAANFPSGTSVHNMAFFGQLIRSRTVHKFDYGLRKNIEVYGSSKPPEYNLSATVVPVVVIYGRNDGIVDIRDVKWLISKLPNVVEAFEVKDPLWTHMDVGYSQYIPQLLYPKIEEYLNI